MLRGLELRILVVVVVLASLGFSHRVYSQPLNDVCIDAERVELGEGLDAVVGLRPAHAAEVFSCNMCSVTESIFFLS